MPAKEQASAMTPGTAVVAVTDPEALTLTASASVATVKNTPNAWTNSSFSMPIRLHERHRRDHLHTGRGRDGAGDETDDAAEPLLVAAGDVQAELAQADDGID